MEDRKRPAVSSADDLAPPSKRQAVNGSKIKEGSVEMKEETWIEKFQKGAIYREMQEYSRRAATIEARLEELHKRSMHHDDHLRLIDAWWRQVLEELEVLAESSIDDSAIPSEPPFLSRVTFTDLHDFQRHLEDKSKAIRTKAETLIRRLADSRGQVSPEVAKLEAAVTSLQEAQKGYMIRIDRLIAEKEGLSEQLNIATLRFYRAEKKLDRAKSSQVQMLEQQALANSTKSAKPSDSSSQAVEVNGNSSEALVKYDEMAAAAAKHKEQLEAALVDIKNLQDENSALKVRRESLSDEDYIRTDVFKHFKSQNEDLIRRINHLEATNKQIKEEADKMQAERSSFRTQLEMDANQVMQELEGELASRDQDLARVRSGRDEMFAELTQRKASLEQERKALDHMKDLVEAKDARIKALESEVLRFRPSEGEASSSADESIDGLSAEELGRKYHELEQKYAALNSEIASMETAYRKTMGMMHPKVMDFAALEDKVALSIAEKAKADQKYFAARKDNETKVQEIRTLRQQNGKSADIISQLKEVEAHNRTLVTNLEKQLAELRKSNTSLAGENKRLEVSNTESARRADSLKMQVGELTTLVKSRDAMAAGLREQNFMQGAEVDKLKVRLEHVQKERDHWKKKAQANSSEEEDNLRTWSLCTVCRNDFKDTVLKTCGHLFCHKCVEDRISNRMRKCPNCSRAFDKMDVMSVHH